MADASVVSLITRDSDGTVFEVLGEGKDYEGRPKVFISQQGSVGWHRITQDQLWVNFTAYPAPTMEVTVRDRSAEAPWGVGLINPVVRTITISAFCPVCGGRRGEPQGLNQCDDGAYYWVQVWTNPCGHTDMYADVVIEAEKLAEAVAS